jgi:hypothetical protein
LGGSGGSVGWCTGLRTPTFNFDPRQNSPQGTQRTRAWRVRLGWSSSATWNLVGAIRLGGCVGDWGCRCKCQGKRTINLDLTRIHFETRATTNEPVAIDVRPCKAPRIRAWWSAPPNWTTLPSSRWVRHRGASRFRPDWPWEQTTQACFAAIQGGARGPGA